MRLLIRHGQTPANVLGQLNTRKPGPGLTRIGEKQAAAVPGALQGERVGAVFASTLLRTQLTGKPLAEARGLPVTVLDGLREVEAGDLEDLTDAASVETYLSMSFAWAAGDLGLRVPGGPDGHEFFARYDDAVATIVASGCDTAAAFSHGMAIRAWAAARATNIGESYASTHQLDTPGWSLSTVIPTAAGGSASGWKHRSAAGPRQTSSRQIRLVRRSHVRSGSSSSYGSRSPIRPRAGFSGCGNMLPFRMAARCGAQTA